MCAVSLNWIISLASSLLHSDDRFSSSAGFVFSRDLRVNFVSHFSPFKHHLLLTKSLNFCLLNMSFQKNIVRLSLEQSLEMLSRIQASVLVVL